MTEPVTALNDDLFNQLQLEPFVLLHTIDADRGSPDVQRHLLDLCD